DVADGDATDHPVLLVLEDQVGDGRSGRIFLPVAADAVVPAAAMQLVGSPAGLPRLKEGAAVTAQRRPFAIIGGARKAERDALPLQRRRFAAEEGEVEHDALCLKPRRRACA